ncbi:hypothetical protein [Nocardia africana]|uniref:hypothetical protein n=1 Tax=Nocardia africana TaxID=134964 RepID=UPI000FE21E87|nr:hypothetical protein [Nocardia africana]
MRYLIAPSPLRPAHGRGNSNSVESRDQPEAGDGETTTCLATPGADNADIGELVALVAAFHRDVHRRIQHRADIFDQPVAVRQCAGEIITDIGTQARRTNDGSVFRRPLSAAALIGQLPAQPRAFATSLEASTHRVTTPSSGDIETIRAIHPRLLRTEHRSRPERSTGRG